MTAKTMPEEGFLRRWARRKSESREGLAPEPEHAPQPAVAAAPDAAAADAALALAVPTPSRVEVGSEPATAPGSTLRLPTMDDVAALGAESDFSAFVARGVDQAVRRSALKKLFADPHFNVMDKLDVYIDDYTKPSPMSEAMLASLGHAKNLFLRAVEDEPDVERPAPPQVQAQAQAQQPPEQETQ
jgi:hypothetical protein